MLHGTDGRGVQVVLNSLAEEKLQASLRCLARHGRFLEIGKYDLSNNTPLGMALFLKNVSFHGILLDAIFEDDNPEWIQVSELLTNGIKSGKCKPLLRSFILTISTQTFLNFIPFSGLIDIGRVSVLQRIQNRRYGALNTWTYLAQQRSLEWSQTVVSFPELKDKTTCNRRTKKTPLES